MVSNPPVPSMWWGVSFTETLPATGRKFCVVSHNALIHCEPISVNHINVLFCLLKSTIGICRYLNTPLLWRVRIFYYHNTWTLHQVLKFCGWTYIFLFLCLLWVLSPHQVIWWYLLPHLSKGGGFHLLGVSIPLQYGYMRHIFCNLA